MIIQIAKIFKRVRRNIIIKILIKIKIINQINNKIIIKTQIDNILAINVIK